MCHQLIYFLGQRMDSEELAHYTEVLMSMKEYEGFVWREAFRKKQHMKRLSEKHSRCLPDFTVKNSIPALLVYSSFMSNYFFILVLSSTAVCKEKPRVLG
jgi:hypothetical protein